MVSNQSRGAVDAPLGDDDVLLSLPDKLRKRLLPFQKEGIKFALSRDGRCMIADEMGLGKTLQALAVACLYRQDWPLLVVVPSSLKFPWMEEMERWVPELGPGDIHLVESKTDTAGISSSKVTVLGYGLLTTDARVLLQALTQQQFQVVVVDESHYMKSRNAARSKILVPLIQKAKRAILLTGTPALGRPEEIFLQIDALYPRRFGTWSEYAKKYCNAHYRYFGTRRQWDCRGASHLDELHLRLGEVMIRRRKAQVLTQLPPKVRQRIPFTLPRDAAKEASASLEEWERLMRRADCTTSENPFTEVMTLVTRMYKQTAMAKAGAVRDYIKMMLENDKLKFLVFAHHLTMLQACTEAVIEAKAGYIRIDGSVPSSERMQLVQRFQNDPDTRVAILSIQAAGQGLTFTAASHVVFAELYWNPGQVKQAEDRAHRIGQTCSVHIHYLIAKGTFDTVMWAMLNRKESVTGCTLNGKKEYLEAELGDKDQWEFLSLARAWSPSNALPAGPEEGGEDVFFSHFQRDGQHDIRSFFSPRAEREKTAGKRPREGEESQDAGAGPGGGNGRSPASGGPGSTPRAKRPRRAGPACGRGGRGGHGGGTPRRPSLPLPPRQRWSCSLCTFSNSRMLLRCQMCDTPHLQGDAGEGVCDETLPLYSSLKFCASKNTDRIYLYDEDGRSLRCNFLPLDVQLQNWEELPAEFRHPENRSHVLRFVREWSSLTAMRQKLIRRSGRIFHSALLLLEELSHTPHRHCTKRYLSKADVAEASLSKAHEAGGSVRIIRRENRATAQRPANRESGGVTNAVAVCSRGRTLRRGEASRLAMSRHWMVQACPCVCPARGPAQGAEASDGGFCSSACHEELRLRSDQSHMRARVLEAEQGVCQHCGLHAHQLYLRVRDAPPTQRKSILENTWLSQLSLKQLNEMIRNPVEGQFWQADHIRPVYSGGGQCLLDNLQTLCTVCHHTRTAQQAAERSAMKRGQAASKLASDITRFFQKK